MVKGWGQQCEGVFVVVLVSFVLLVYGEERVFGRVGCPFVVMCCSIVFEVYCSVLCGRVEWG